MGKSSNPVMIGAFVLTAVAITVISIMLLGGAKLFEQKDMFVSYFSETTNGLDIGAPVKYKGVKVGKVEDIRLRIYNHDLRDSTVKVIYSIDINALRRKTGNTNLPLQNASEITERQIREGLRAKLNYQSIVTGMLYIELDYLAEANQAYTTHSDEFSEYKEIPVALSGLSEMGKTFEKVLNNIAQIDFSQIAQNANKLLLDVDNQVMSLDVKQINEKAIITLNNLNKVLEDPKITHSIENLDKLLADTRKLVADVDVAVGDVSKSVNKLADGADEVMENVNSIIAPQSPFRYELAMLLKQLSESLSSFKNLAEFIERNPNAFITGKAGDTESKSSTK